MIVWSRCDEWDTFLPLRHSISINLNGVSETQDSMSGTQMSMLRVVSLTWILKQSEVICAKLRRCRTIRARLLDLTMIIAWAWGQCVVSIFSLLDASRSDSWRVFFTSRQRPSIHDVGCERKCRIFNRIWNICVLKTMMLLRAGSLFTAIDPQFLCRSWRQCA